MGSLIHKVYGGLRLMRVCRDWPSWFREYFSKANDQRARMYRFRNGAVLHTRRNRSDLHMIDEIWAFRKYEYFGFCVAPRDVVVDIGANIGTFSVYAATIGRSSRVIAFEPHPENYALLCRNVEANNLCKVECVNAGVAGERGPCFLEVNAQNAGAHRLLIGKEVENATVCQVQTCTLPDVFEQYHLDTIDYLKMDCEGAEFAIFGATPDNYLRRIKRISMETHPVPGKSVVDFTSRLQQLGFGVRTFDGHRPYARLYARQSKADSPS